MKLIVTDIKYKVLEDDLTLIDMSAEEVQEQLSDSAEFEFNPEELNNYPTVEDYIDELLLSYCDWDVDSYEWALEEIEE